MRTFYYKSIIKKIPKFLSCLNVMKEIYSEIQFFFLFWVFLRTDALSENQEMFTSHSQNSCVPPKYSPEGETRKRS